MSDPLVEPGPWNAVANAYDSAWSTRLTELPDRACEIVAPKQSPDTARMVVLDVAAGPGQVTLRLAQRVARVVAVDFAENMIERLRAHLDRERIADVETHVMDGQALTFADASFDAVVSMFGWFLFDDRARGLAQFHRVLRDGGRLLVTSWMPPDQNQALGVGLTALRAALPDLKRPPGPLPTQQPDVCVAELRAAGFRDVNATVVRVPTIYSSAESYWADMERAGAPLVVLRKKLGDEAWQQASERAREYLRAQHGTGEFTLWAEAIFTTGVR